MIDRDTYRVKPGAAVRLADVDPARTSRYADKRDAAAKLKKDITELAKLQDMLSAEARHGVLVIFQGMDTAGKDGAVKHVTSGINPQGVHVFSFKEPTDEERKHDYLWRCAKVVPERGRMGIFNRSYYEDVVVVRVHPELLEQSLGGRPQPSEDFWRRRYEDINAFERYLARNRIRVVKFFLHISKDEQKKRLLARLAHAHKQWKFSESDLQQRAYWKRYMSAYEKMLAATSTTLAPWYVVPSDHKWFTRVAVADILVAELKALGIKYPKLPTEMRAKLRRQREALQSE